MSDNVNVKPTPIQRNEFDVALELTQLELRMGVYASEDLEEIFAKYYAIAKVLKNKRSEQLEALLSENLLKDLKR